MFNVNFNEHDPQIICHSDYKKLIPEILEILKPYQLNDHFILFSSGTTGGALKGYALSKTALFENARAVNKHFKLTPEDVWGLSLPTYHVGGLSVLARAHLLENIVIDLRSWDPEHWAIRSKDVTITTIVPTQLYDLVKRKISPSPKLKYLVVGGDYLSTPLKNEAIKLGWPVIRTYGMSEVCSQLASTTSPQSDDLQILPIHQVKVENEKLLIKSQAIFTLEFILGKQFKITSSKELSTGDGFYMTKDRAEISGSIIRPLGRIGDEYKIAGHLIDLNSLRDTLSAYLLKKDLYNQMELVVEEDERKGKKLVLLSLPGILDRFHQEEISDQLKPTRIEEFREVPELSRTILGKLKRNTLS